MSSKKIISITTIIISMGLFAIALTQKCYCTENSCGDSMAVFISGAFGFLMGGAALCWLANPFLIFSWLFIRKNKASLILSSIAFLFAISFLLFNKIMINEAGHYGKIIEYKLGYWLWLSSSFIMVIGNMAIRTKVKKLNDNN